MGDTKILKDGFQLGIIYLLILYATIFIPALELLTIFVLPVPFILFAARYGKKPVVVFNIILFVLVLFLAALLSIPLTILAGFGGTLIGLGIHAKLTPYETWARGTLGFVLGLLFIFLFIQLVWNINLINQFNLAVADSVTMSQEMLQTIGLNLSTNELDLIRQQMLQLATLVPVFLVALAIFLSFVSQWIGYRLIGRFDKLRLRFPPFRDFQLPKIIIWIYLLAIIFTWMELDPNSMLNQVVLNVVNLAALLIVLQGFSFIFYYVHVKKRTKVIPIIAIIVSILFPFIGLYLIRLLGIIDLGFSLRERIKKTN
ncbi:YybS family protein [Aquibacillus salsiterrae]|uniref:YybS family protein n=1 Tax=Aquibacillus salsiterrae TaxID=2950439 RepID=A0A9X3WJD2_9BACI|nr:DUF2232 domain-containing protein [Aquibacillus salsiterrae]MDC3418499.1 YybS family protein [Aquibacillus salsiterrae]